MIVIVAVTVVYIIMFFYSVWDIITGSGLNCSMAPLTCTIALAPMVQLLVIHGNKLMWPFLNNI